MLGNARYHAFNRTQAGFGTMKTNRQQPPEDLTKILIGQEPGQPDRVELGVSSDSYSVIDS